MSKLCWTRARPRRHVKGLPLAGCSLEPGWRPVALASVAAVALIWAAMLATSTSARAETAWPTRTIRLVAPFSAGGSSDLMGRLLAQKVADSLGQPVTVDNRPGAGGNIGHEIVARSTPDGHTLVLTSSVSMVNNVQLYKRPGFDPVADFAPVTMIGISGTVLVVPATLPVKTVAELTAFAREQPGKLNYGSGGRGTTAHITAEVFRTATGTELVHVPYKGSGDAVAALLTGQIQMVFSDTAPAIAHIRAGKLRALAVSSDRRFPVLADVPTLLEAGLPGEPLQTWWGILAPTSTPATVVARLNEEFGRALKQPEVIDRFTALGVFPMHTSPEALSERIRIETPRMARIFKGAGIEPE